MLRQQSLDKRGLSRFIDIIVQICKYCHMSDTEIEKLASLLKAMGEFNRLSIVYELCQCKAPQNAMCLCSCCSVDASGVSRHLKILEQEGVVSSEKKGRQVTYSLNRKEVASNLRALADIVEINP